MDVPREFVLALKELLDEVAEHPATPAAAKTRLGDHAKVIGSRVDASLHRPPVARNPGA